MIDLPRCKRLLEIRQQLSLASTAKYKAYLDRVQADERMRNLLLFDGASTGRWTAKGVQLQNLPSRGLCLGSAEVPAAISAALAGCVADYYADPLSVAKACIRGMLIPAEGHRFICADYSAIEGRGLAWLAGETEVLDAYRAGKRMYCVAAEGIYGVPYQTIYDGRKTDPSLAKMDSVGKVAELACGYAGSVGAFRKMERGYNMDLGMTDPEIKDKITSWRESRPMTVRLWHGLENACFEAVENPGVITTYRAIKFKVVGKFLMMCLPSGRLLYYFDPKIEPQEMPWRDKKTGGPVFKDCVSYWGVDSQTKRWMKFFAYGGLLAENAVQALSRDILAAAMLRLDAAGYQCLLTIHDEILAQMRNGQGSLEDFIRIMTIIESWADGFPINAAGWEGPRYKKD